MNKKTTSIVVMVLVITLGAVMWNFLRSDDSAQQLPALDQKNKAEVEVISIDKPASFAGVEMVTYKSPYGYEITYPKKWVAILAPKETHLHLENYALYPKNIPYGPSPVLDITVSEKSLSEVFLGLNINEFDMKKISVNDTNGYKFKSPNHPSTSYFFEIADRAYRIIYWYSPEYKISEQEAFWVLSTFKITK